MYTLFCFEFAHECMWYAGLNWKKRMKHLRT